MFPDDADPNGFDRGLAELEALSNGALDLIVSGRFSEAERMCLELKLRFPDQIDWIEHSAALHEARGQFDQAIERHAACLTHIDRHPDGFDSGSRAVVPRSDRSTVLEARPVKLAPGEFGLGRSRASNGSPPGCLVEVGSQA